MTEPSGPDIVVVGERQNDGTISFSILRSSGRPAGIRYVEPRTISENPENPVLEIVVAIEKTSSASDEAKMIEAAQALIKAIERAIRLLEAEARTRVVSVLGFGISVGALLDELMRTDFSVTDVLNFGNNGVGGAERIPLGRNRDRINYQAIVGGRPDHPTRYYAHPNFANGEGMLALVLHEIFHLTQAGEDFLADSLQLWTSRGGTSATFYSSALAANLERIANAYALGFLDVLLVPYDPAFPPVQPTDTPVNPTSVP